MVWEETWSLIWEWGSLTAVITRAPSASLTESSTSALPGLRALLGTLPVVGFGDGAVLIVWVSLNVGSPVTLPEFLGVIVVLSVGWDNFMTESNWLVWDSWDHDVLNVVWVMVVSSGRDSGNKGSNSKFHFIY